MAMVDRPTRVPGGKSTDAAPPARQSDNVQARGIVLQATADQGARDPFSCDGTRSRVQPQQGSRLGLGRRKGRGGPLRPRRSLILLAPTLCRQAGWRIEQIPRLIYQIPTGVGRRLEARE